MYIYTYIYHCTLLIFHTIITFLPLFNPSSLQVVPFFLHDAYIYTGLNNDIYAQIIKFIFCMRENKHIFCSHFR